MVYRKGSGIAKTGRASNEGLADSADFAMDIKIKDGASYKVGGYDVKILMNCESDIDLASHHIRCCAFHTSPVFSGSSFPDSTIQASSALVFAIYTDLFLYYQYHCRTLHGNF